MPAILLMLLVIGGCKDDDFGGPGPESSAVSTLVADLAANDALTIDKKGNIYASNFGQFGANGGDGTTILKISPSGKVVEYATGLNGPLGNAINSKGDLYVADGNAGVSGDIIKISEDGDKTVITTISGWPSGLTFDHRDNLFVANYLDGKIHKITRDGAVSIYAEDPGLAGCVGIDLDEQGNVITANYNDGNIFLVTPQAEVKLIASVPDVIPFFGIGYMTYFKGYVFATGIGTNLIYKISLDGAVEIFAGNGVAAQVDGTLLEASFANPNGIVIDKARKFMYISDFGQPALRKIQL